MPGIYSCVLRTIVYVSGNDVFFRGGIPMSTSVTKSAPDGLAIEDSWGEFVAGRYREGKSESEFRNYDAAVVPTVAAFYKENHERQTLDFVLAKEKEYFALNKGKMSIWEAAEFLNTLVDESD